MDLILLQQTPPTPLSAYFVCYVPLAIVVIGLITYFVITDRHASRPYARLLPVEGVDDLGMTTTDPTHPPVRPDEGIPPRSTELRPDVPPGTGMQEDTVKKATVPDASFRTSEPPPLRDDRAFTGEQIARAPGPDDAQSPPPPRVGPPPAPKQPGPSGVPPGDKPKASIAPYRADVPPPPAVGRVETVPNSGLARERSAISYEPADPQRAPNSPVRIAGIFKASTPEVVELENVSNEPVSLDGWQVVSVRAFQIHRGIGGMLMPGERKAFPYTGRGNMWNNRERDDGALYDPTGKLISYWSDTE